MNSYAEQLADAVAAVIAADALADLFALPFAPVVEFAPEYRLGDGDFDTPRVSVLPSLERTLEREDRDHWRETHKITIGVMGKPASKARADVAPLMLLAQQIADCPRLESLASPVAELVGRAQSPVYDAEALLGEGLFLSLIELTYLVGREETA